MISCNQILYTILKGTSLKYVLAWNMVHKHTTLKLSCDISTAEWAKFALSFILQKEQHQHLITMHKRHFRLSQYTAFKCAHYPVEINQPNDILAYFIAVHRCFQPLHTIAACTINRASKLGYWGWVESSAVCFYAINPSLASVSSLFQSYVPRI